MKISSRLLVGVAVGVLAVEVEGWFACTGRTLILSHWGVLDVWKGTFARSC